MPTICMFRGIKIFINWREHRPPHFHATYGGEEVVVLINELEVFEGSIPSKQLKMLVKMLVLKLVYSTFIQNSSKFWVV